MMTRTTLGLALFLTSSATFAQAACSVDVIQTKAPEVTTAIQTIAARNPDRVPALQAELEQQMTAIQNGGDMAPVCTFFDQVIAEAQG
ncbi:hypothetical protein ACJ5NV_19840 [Loktanella agnita]|uniref:hypothetical protein n=1 Tax=Loktanella agnita TaxID=287097 RepID=UPI00398936FE